MFLWMPGGGQNWIGVGMLVAQSCKHVWEWGRIEMRNTQGGRYNERTRVNG